MSKNRPGSLTFVGKLSLSSRGSIKNGRFSGHGSGKAGQTQTTKARQSGPEAGQTEQARRAQNTAPVQENCQTQARRAPDKAGKEQARTAPRANDTCIKRRACAQKIGRKQANQSKAEANKGKQETGKKQAESPENAAPVHRKRAATCPTKQARSKRRQARTGRTVASIAQFTW